MTGSGNLLVFSSDSGELTFGLGLHYMPTFDPSDAQYEGVDEGHGRVSSNCRVVDLTVIPDD